MTSLAIILAFAGVLLGVIAVTRDLRSLRAHRSRQAIYDRHLPFDIDKFLLRGMPTGIKEAVNSVAAEILSELPGYRLKGLIGALSGRLVFEAVDAQSHRLVVKTVLDDKRLSRARVSLFNEALVIGHLGGTRAPRLLKAAVTAADRPYIVRQMLSGVSLDRVLFEMASRGSPPLLRDVRIALSSAADAVEEVHRRGVVHGDLKPANIIAEWRVNPVGALSLQPLGPVFLLDFEAATIIEHQRAVAAPEVSRGTPFFMAPERYAHSRFNAAADVYSLSAIAALLLTGRPERPGSHAGQRIPSPGLRKAIRKGMSVDVRERQSTVAEWNEEVSAAFVNVPDDVTVDWPRDPDAIRREVAEEALSITVGSFEYLSFERVQERIDLPTFDAAVRSRLEEIDPVTRRLVEAVWFRGLAADIAAKELDLDPVEARNSLDQFTKQLASYIRDLAVERERSR